MHTLHGSSRKVTHATGILRCNPEGLPHQFYSVVGGFAPLLSPSSPAIPLPFLLLSRPLVQVVSVPL